MVKPKPKRKRVRTNLAKSKSPGYDGRKPILRVVEGVSEVERKARETVVRNHNHCELCKLFFRKEIDAIHHKAGEKLQDDAYRSLAGNMGASSFLAIRTSSSKTSDPVANLLDAVKRKNSALVAVGPEASAILNVLVIQDSNVGQTALRLGVNRKSVTHALRVALGALAAHYGLITS